MRILSLLICLNLSAQAAVLVEENGIAVAPVQTSQPQITTSSSYSVSNGFDFRRRYRAGVGLSAGGTLGTLGVSIELNLNPQNSASIGFGGSGNYSSFGFNWKRVISGNSVLPYVSLGYARIFNRQENSDKSKISPSFIADKLMSKSDLSDGRFAVDLLTPSLGVQYVQLNGDWTGLSVGMEVNLLFSLQRMTSVPTGSIVTMYYF